MERGLDRPGAAGQEQVGSRSAHEEASVGAGECHRVALLELLVHPRCPLAPHHLADVEFDLVTVLRCTGNRGANFARNVQIDVLAGLELDVPPFRQLISHALDGGREASMRETVAV